MEFAFLQSAYPDDSAKLQEAKWNGLATSYADGDETKSSGWYIDHWERELSVAGIEAEQVFEQARSRLINFDLVPPHLAQFTTTWNIEGRMPEAGDRVFQRTRFFHLGSLQLVDVFSMTCVAQVIDEEKRFLLQYLTTQGHPESGTARYVIERTEDNRVFFRIHAIAKPTLWTTRLVKRFITRPIQLKITKGILDTMERGLRLDLTGQEDNL